LSLDNAGTLLGQVCCILENSITGFA
jgi:hypothetical protein